MARQIDADELKEHLFVGADYDKAINDGISKTDEEVFAFQCGWNDALKSVAQFAPTVDAVEVVRCRDCKHKPTGSGVNHDITFPEQDYRCPCRCEDYWYSWMPDDDWFCANGERREDADT